MHMSTPFSTETVRELKAELRQVMRNRLKKVSPEDIVEQCRRTSIGSNG